ncbi:MAG: hypothetical protein R2712_26395 [Vicinamibacterales bacterium]
MRFTVVLALLAVLAAAAPTAEQPAASAFPLTVDSIMRGPALVGYPPGDLRWSGDARELYFEWRMPGEDEPATWVTGRDGGAPRRLTDEERMRAPLARGQWNADRTRILGIDRGDVVIIDTVARRRIEITRTTGAEYSPRWAQGGTAVTFVRDNNLFLVPIGGDDAGGLAAHRRGGAEAGSAPHRQPAHAAWRGSGSPRLGQEEKAAPAAARGAGRARSRTLRAGRAPVGGGCRALRRRNRRVLVVSERAQSTRSRGAPVR